MLRELGVRLGEEAFAARVLQRFGSKRNLLVLNDEAHHAYRPAPFEDEKATAEMGAEEKRRLKQEKEAATVWISGLDRINAARGINFCMDLSATPFYIRGSGYTEGLPLRTHGVRAPWLASDFGLVDAIESGIVKIPRMPVEANSGRPVPEYFALWQWINENLPRNAKIITYGEPRGFYLDREYLWGDPGHHTLIPYQSLRSPEDLIEHWTRLGVTHVLINQTYFPLEQEGGLPALMRQGIQTGDLRVLHDTRNGRILVMEVTSGRSRGIKD